MVDLGAIAAYEPRWPGVKELNIADDWRARWVDEQSLPENAPVHYAYALVVMGDKGYGVRESGGNRWGMLEGATGGVASEAFVTKSAKEWIGATLSRVELIGFFECRATMHNKQFKQGELTVRPLYLAVAKSMSDVAPNKGYERRRFPMNEYAVAMRGRYAEFLDYLQQAFQRYAVIQAKG
ncbi:hypothetical protein [Candidatus Amarobacter glycogenicus]|uniref:hypothetical protein n=1 Tax=Candidatus Amarobacter glycogenicus TaxID=3140699 RepID=UPI003136B2DC|nr:hypothetical protein [Dehalococcoidia bacterium]